MQHPYPAFGTEATATLLSGGVVLLPTANLWQVVAHGGQRAAVEKLLRLCPPSPENHPELVFPDVSSLRSWCPRIDPTLDTLLHYHRRPLTMCVPAGPRVPLRLLDERGEVHVRLALDSYTYRLCEDLEHPLVAALAMGSGVTELPVCFGRIRSDILRGADYVVQRRQLDRLGEVPAVTVRVNEAEELEFIRG